MKVLVLEPVGGIAGDMTLAALLHLGADRALLDAGIAALGVPAKVAVSEVEVSGIRALHVDVETPDEGHVHRPYRVVRELIARADLPPKAAALAQRTFERLAVAEGRVHGIAPDDVEFHEVGAVDAIVDVVGSALLLSSLAPDRVVALPPPSGGGVGTSAHGRIPLPAPATLELLRGRSLRPSGPGERITPTGAALLAACTEPVDALPELSPDRIGYGAGTRRWDDAPNVLRAILGTAAEGSEAAVVLEANLDDLSPQLLAVALEAAMAAGALDAWIAPLTMKKGRPGHLFGALAPLSAVEPVRAAIFRETSTLGVRETRVNRSVLDRELVEVKTAYGPIRVKVGRLRAETLNAAPEFEDCRAAARAHGVPVKEVLAEALAAFRRR